MLQTLLLTLSAVHFATFGFFEGCFLVKRGPQARYLRNPVQKPSSPAAGGRTVSALVLAFSIFVTKVTKSQNQNKTGKTFMYLNLKKRLRAYHGLLKTQKTSVEKRPYLNKRRDRLLCGILIGDFEF